MLLAASFASSALFLVEEIEGGYFDKLRATPVPRSAIVVGRLIAEGTKSLLIASLIVLLGLAFGITIASGVLKIDNAQNFGSGARIAGLATAAQQIDLVDINFGAATLGYVNSGLSGTLTVSDGVHAATLTLIGSYLPGNFKIANDGAGGTTVTDPPVSSAAGMAPPH